MIRRNIVLVGLVFIGLIVVVVLVLLARTDDDRILLFNPPGCTLPCVLGITPGITSFDDALRVIDQTIPPQQIVSAGSFWIKTDQGTRIDILLQRTDPREGDYVVEIQLSSDDRITTLGTLLRSYGEPSTVFRGRVAGPNSVRLLITFEKEPILAVIVGDHHVNAQSPVILILAVASNKEDRAWKLYDLRVQSHFDDEIEWLGYASVDDYWSTLPKR